MRSALKDLRQDSIYAVRRMVRTAGFSAVGIVSLAIGIGVCSLLFAQLNALIWRPLPGAADPSGLTSLQQPVPYPFFEAYRDQSNIGRAWAAFIGPVPFGVGTGRTTTDTERVFGHLVSPEYFDTVGVAAQLGRVFSPGSERPGSEAAVVVSDRYWQTRLGGDPNVVGQALQVNGRPLTIVGVGPPDFRGVYPINPADLFVPVTVGEAVAPELRDDALTNRDVDRFLVVFRLAPGMSTSLAEATLDVMTRNLRDEQEIPELERSAREIRLLSAEGISPISHEQRMMMVGSNLIILGMVMTLVCGNLATLLLAGASERRREIAIRLSLGVGRSRLVRQLVTEAVAIALVGGAAGLLVTQSLVRLSAWMTPATAVPVEIDISVDWSVVAFAVVISVAAGVGFGWLPALSATRSEVAGTLKGSALVPLRRYRRLGARNLLMVHQVAGALTLVLVTGWVVVGYQRSTNVDAGFDTTNLYLFNVDPPRDGLSVEQSRMLLAHMEERLPLRAEVEALTVTASFPFASLAVTPNLRVSVATSDGRTDAGHVVLRRRVGAQYFSTLGVPIFQGREFDARDRCGSGVTDFSAPSETPVVINEAAAGELFGTASPLGQRIRALGSVLPTVQVVIGRPATSSAAAEELYRVVGVARDIKSAFLNAETVPTVFLPITTDTFAHSSPQGMTIAVRRALAADVMGAVRDELAIAFPAVTMFNTRTLDQHVGQLNSLVLWSSLVNGSIGGFGLILAAIGLAGVTAHAVVRRRKEIAIRISLGARNYQVLRLMLAESLVLVAVGTGLGLAGAAAIARVFSALAAEFARILSMGVDDPLLLVAGPLLLGFVTLLACYLPARRATSIDPLPALREE